MTNRRRLVSLATMSLVACLLFPATAAAAGPYHGGSTPHMRVIVSGLNNPRGIDPGPFGSLLVAEAGKGGTTDCQAATNPETGQPTTLCLGRTGAIDLILGNHKFRLATLPSVATTDGMAASGPTHAVLGPRGVLISMMGIPPLPFSGSTNKFAKLLRLHDGSKTVVADLGAYEAAHNPDGKQIDSDPYGLALNGRGAVMTDAGANDLLAISRTGAISTLAVFPDQMADAPAFLNLPLGTKIPTESVPTAVTRGPDGAWYVGELTGFPFQVGLARIWRVVRGQEPTVFATGFTNIIDLQFDRHGRLYVLEMAKFGLLAAGAPGGDPSGALIRINRDGSRTEIASAGLVLPGGVAIDAQGHIYVTNNSTSPGAGEVVRLK